MRETKLKGFVLSVQYDKKYLYRHLHAYTGIFFVILYLLSTRIQCARYNCEKITEISRDLKSNAKQDHKYKHLSSPMKRNGTMT
jgi:proline racemase